MTVPFGTHFQQAHWIPRGQLRATNALDRLTASTPRYLIVVCFNCESALFATVITSLLQVITKIVRVQMFFQGSKDADLQDLSILDKHRYGVASPTSWLSWSLAAIEIEACGP